MSPRATITPLEVTLSKDEGFLTKRRWRHAKQFLFGAEIGARENNTLDTFRVEPISRLNDITSTFYLYSAQQPEEGWGVNKPGWALGKGSDMASGL